jgi:hypothetical protein
LGLILLLVEGLYLEISLYQLPPIEDDFPQIVHSFSICKYLTKKLNNCNPLVFLVSLVYGSYNDFYFINTFVFGNHS